MPGVELITYDEPELCNWQYIGASRSTSRPPSRATSCMRVLWAENVLARRYFYPGCHRMEPYRTLFPDVGERLPQTERLAERVLALPTGTAMDPASIAIVADLIHRVMLAGPELTRRAARRQLGAERAGECAADQLRARAVHRSSALDGVLAQEGVEFELLAGDDASTDGTREVLARYAREHPRG